MAMYKGKKQKIHGHGYRYSSHYGKKNNTPKIFITVLLCLALVACGYFVATPFLDKFIGENTDLTSSTVSTETSSFTVSYEEIDETQSSVESQIPQKGTDGDVYLAEYSQYADANALNALIEKAKNGGYETLMLNLKSQDGILHYNSSVELALEADAVENTVDLAAVIKQIKDVGLRVGVKINVFDEYCLPWDMRSTALHANAATSTLWYDFVSRDISSGSPWLNPANETAQKYNLDIIAELAQYDIDSIYLEGVHFPVWGKINVYQLDPSIDREKTITEFVSKAREITQNTGKTLGVIVPLCGAVMDYHEKWESYGFPDAVFNLDADTVVVDARADRIFLQSWYSEMTVGEQKIDDFEKADTERYKAVIDSIKASYALSSMEREVTVWVNEAQGEKLPQDENVNKMIKS